MTSQKGAVLPAILVLVIFLGLMAVTFVQMTRYNTIAVKAESVSLRLDQYASAGIERAIFGLSEKDVSYQRHGAPFTFIMGQAEISVSIWDEKGKVDLNSSPMVLIEGLLLDLEVPSNNAAQEFNPEDVLNEIEERRKTARSGGGVAFRTVYDLNSVSGISAPIFSMLVPHITISNYSSKINFTTASERVLNAVPGLTHADISAVLEGRKTSRRTKFNSAVEWHSNLEGPFYRVKSTAQIGDKTSATRDVIIWLQDNGEYAVVESRPSELAVR